MTNHTESFWNASPKVVNKVFVVERIFFSATLKSNQRRHIKQSELLSEDEP